MVHRRSIKYILSVNIFSFCQWLLVSSEITWLLAISLVPNLKNILKKKELWSCNFKPIVTSDNAEIKLKEDYNNFISSGFQFSMIVEKVEHAGRLKIWHQKLWTWLVKFLLQNVILCQIMIWKWRRNNSAIRRFLEECIARNGFSLLKNHPANFKLTHWNKTQAIFLCKRSGF